jgi:uncharacterized membrane protein YfcA
MNTVKGKSQPMRTSTNPRYWSPWLVLFAIAWCVAYFTLAPHPESLLVSNWFYGIVGFTGAVIGNVTALGGGLIFIPFLIFLCHVPPVMALKTSIVSQAFGMTSGALIWNKTKKIPWHIVPWAVPGLLLGGTISSLIIQPNAMLVKGLFGPVSITLGCLLLLSLKRKEGGTTWNTWTKLAVVCASAVGGLITGWVAIGEGELVAASLMLFFGYSAELAIPLGVCLLSVNSIYLAVIHATLLGGLPWNIAAFTVVGCVFGARLAPLCARFINPRTLKSTFAIVAILDGLLFLTQFFLWSHQ